MSTAPATKPARVDSRAPRWVGGYTFVLSVLALFFGLAGGTGATLGQRVAGPAFVLVLVLWVSFGLGVVFGNPAHPAAIAYRRWVQPRLSTPIPTEDARPPRFALLVGFVVSSVGLLLEVAGVPLGLAIAAGVLIVASSLQAFAGLCLGCQVFVLLVRVGAIRLRAPLG